MVTSVLRSTMAFYTTLILLLATLSGVNADGTVGPSNETLPNQSVTQFIFYGMNSMSQPLMLRVSPLTANAGLGESTNTINNILYNGTLRLTDAFNYSSIRNTDITYISCDSNSNASNIDASGVVNAVAISKPTAILLYSATQNSCAIIGNFGDRPVLTMTSIADSTALRVFIDSQNSMNASPMASITTEAVQNSRSGGTPGGGLGTQPQQVQTGPTTAVAMSILYSITGIITVLFLVIIATGAIRAHRHPERYGPRGGFPGRPRQSRAKGLARAMLETLPIVKFGDDEPVKPPAAGSEIELEEGRRQATADVSNGSKSTTEAAKASADMAKSDESGMGADTQAAAASVNSKDESPDALGCSICTEDFTKGEDVRVLPCNHKYHPACIDPWLLNVSGTCPLCRVDLRPTPTNDSVAETDELSPPLNVDADGHPRQASIGDGRLDVAALRAVPASERLAALRALRAERRQQQRDVLAQRGIPDPDAEPQRDVDIRRTNRLTMRLKEKFRVITHRGEGENGEGSSSSPVPAQNSTAEPRN